MDNIVFFTIITGRKYKDELLDELAKANAHLISTLYSRDYVEASNLQYAFGLIPDENEVMMTCIMADSKADEVFRALIEKHNFCDPETGVAYTFKVDKLSF